MILLSTPAFIYGIFIITNCINSYIILTANLADFKLIARDLIHGNISNILSKIIAVSNRHIKTKDVSNDRSDDYLDDLKVNLRRSSKVDDYKTEESADEEIIKEANRYVIEQLGKHIKERVINDLVSRFLRNKFNLDRTDNTQKNHVRNTAKNQQYYKKPNVRPHKDDKIRNSEEISRDSQLQMKRWPSKHFAKNFNNEAKGVLLKQKVTANKPTQNPSETRRPRYALNNDIRNKQVKGNEIYVILQPKVDSKEKNNQDIKGGSFKNKPITTTRKFRFIKKTRKDNEVTERYKQSEASPRKPSTLENIFEKIKLNTIYSVKDIKVQIPRKDKKIKSNRDIKDKVSKESDVVKAITSYLWVDGEEDDIEIEKVKEKSQESTMESKNHRLQTTPYITDGSQKIVDKYDSGEPIPEKDRLREVVKTIKKPPSRINKKQMAILK